MGQIIISTKQLAKRQMAKQIAKKKRIEPNLKGLGTTKPNPKKFRINPDKIDCRNCSHYQSGICHVISARLKKKHKVFNSTVATVCEDFMNRTPAIQKVAVDKSKKVNVYIYTCPTRHKRFELQAILNDPLPICGKCHALSGSTNHLSFEKKAKMPLEAIERKQQQLEKTLLQRAASSSNKDAKRRVPKSSNKLETVENVVSDN